MINNLIYGYTEALEYKKKQNVEDLVMNIYVIYNRRSKT